MRGAVALIGIGFWLLMAGWVGANPLAAAPDEPAHYIRAVGAASGDLVGRPGPPVDAIGHSPVELQWYSVITRYFRVDPSRLPSTFDVCEAFQPKMSAACRPSDASALAVPRSSPAGTYTGAYPPATFVIPGALTSASSNPVAGWYLARAGFALTSLVLLTLSLVVACRAFGLFGLAGWSAAVTPMAVASAATVNPSGPEIAAGVCAASALLSLSFSRREVLAWVALAAGGSVLIVARTPGPAWFLLVLVIPLVLRGLRGALASIREGGRAAAVAVGIIATAAGVAAAWDLAVRVPPVGQVQIGLFTRQLVGAAGQTMTQGIGDFGWLDTVMPDLAYDLWLIALTTLLIGALIVGAWRQRALVVIIVLLTVAAYFWIGIFVEMPTGFDIQGRHLLPIAVAVPLVAGAVLNRRLALRRARDALPLAIVAITLLVQLAAWFVNARRYAVGIAGPIAFFAHAQWLPPGGWTPWLILWLGAAAVFGVALVLAWQRRGSWIPDVAPFPATSSK